MNGEVMGIYQSVENRRTEEQPKKKASRNAGSVGG